MIELYRAAHAEGTWRTDGYSEESVISWYAVSVNKATHVLPVIYGFSPPHSALVIGRESEECYGCCVLCARRSEEPRTKS